MSKNIPTYNLNHISKDGLVIELVKETSEETNRDIEEKGVHRDSHYLFLFLQSGKAEVMVDFKDFEVEGPAIFCITPGQVHYSKNFDIYGWFLAVNSELVAAEVRAVFEESVFPILPVKIEQAFAKNLDKCAQLLNFYHKKTKNDLNIVKSLLDAYTAMLASAFSETPNLEKIKESRALKLTRQFKTLVKQKFKTLKSPSSYAELMNISPSYLSEVVKDITGNPAGYWIQQEIIIEAKRLLFYTDLTVKEIANELGYDDYAYFSRLFSKQTKQSALDFRKKNKAEFTE
ncbi:AraC-like DNA-binding protein [Epilithonimonas hungarica]|uniref:AraC family transcriptional regulator n=1 Tax=Epilithonimonas hungarica TaxID=454006 RepID=UPI0012C56AE0|nr:helix-turn-helix transcriptional regulator [Epilithonimonas hungarica]MDP9956420.1 AraC-like DNA-binding protein [Epilithonimonas hungarica]MPT31201.1 helix-turn-helix domain-containing protein [Chryseobacterium sp.]